MLITKFTVIFCLFLVALSINVIRIRRQNKIPYGDGGNDVLARAIRAHGNFVEYVPFALFAIFLVEINMLGRTAVMLMLSMLLLGRISHAAGLLFFEPQNKMPRQIGMMLTFASIIFASLVMIKSFFV
jgi:uncharacterized membrane protein YecN with MAPEG domain